MASFIHVEETNVEASGATRWEKPGSLDDLVEQSHFPSLDHTPTPGHGRGRNFHLVRASVLWLSQ